MTKQKLVSWILVAIMAIGGLNLSAQSRQGRNYQNNVPMQNRLSYLDLSDSQQEQAKVIFTKRQKESTPLSANIQEKRAQLNMLMIADEPNEKEVLAKVKEIADLRLKTQEIRISSRLALRNILNADQKVLFDARTVGHGNNRGSRGNKTGMNNRRGNGSNRF